MENNSYRTIKTRNEEDMELRNTCVFISTRSSKRDTTARVTSEEMLNFIIREWKKRGKLRKNVGHHRHSYHKNDYYWVRLNSG